MGGNIWGADICRMGLLIPGLGVSLLGSNYQVRVVGNRAPETIRLEVSDIGLIVTP